MRTSSNRILHRSWVIAVAANLCTVLVGQDINKLRNPQKPLNKKAGESQNSPLQLWTACWWEATAKVTQHTHLALRRGIYPSMHWGKRRESPWTRSPGGFLNREVILAWKNCFSWTIIPKETPVKPWIIYFKHHKTSKSKWAWAGRRTKLSSV